MSFRFPWCSCWLGFALLAAGSVQAQVPPPGSELPSPIGAPPAADPSATSPKATRKDGLRYLEEELSKSLQFFSGKNALDGVMAPAPLSLPRATTLIGPKRQSNDNPEGRDNWASPGQRRPDSERPFDSLKAQGRNSPPNQKPAFEEFFQKRNRDSSARFNSDPRERLPSERGSFEKRPSTTDETLPPEIRQKEQSLREKLFGGEPKSGRIYNPTGNGLFSDLFNHEQKGMSREEEKAQNDYLDRYRQTLSVAPVNPGMTATFQPLAPTTTPAALPAPAYDFFNAATHHESSSAIPWSASASLRQQDYSSKVLNQWNPLYQPPKYEPAPAMPRQAPAFMDTPRRRF